jgi:hypothetical protein
VQPSFRRSRSPAGPCDRGARAQPASPPGPRRRRTPRRREHQGLRVGFRILGGDLGHGRPSARGGGLIGGFKLLVGFKDLTRGTRRSLEFAVSLIIITWKVNDRHSSVMGPKRYPNSRTVRRELPERPAFIVLIMALVGVQAVSHMAAVHVLTIRPTISASYSYY